jgi:hypothetical protein
MGLCKQVRSAFGKCAHTVYVPACHAFISYEIMSMVAWSVPTRPVWEGSRYELPEPGGLEGGVVPYFIAM